MRAVNNVTMLHLLTNFFIRQPMMIMLFFIPMLTNISHQCNEDHSQDPANYCNHVPLTSNAQTYSGLCKLLAQKQGFKIGCLDIRGLLNKIDEMKIIFKECNFDIMGVCETFIDHNIADHEISIDGYNCVKKNRNRHGGGVLVYIR